MLQNGTGGQLLSRATPSSSASADQSSVTSRSGTEFLSQSYQSLVHMDQGFLSCPTGVPSLQHEVG